MNTPRTNEESYPFIWMNKERSTPEGFAKHIFDWGMQSFALKPELYRAERDKAISQMKDFVSTERTARLEAEREVLDLKNKAYPLQLHIKEQETKLTTLKKELDEARAQIETGGLTMKKWREDCAKNEKERDEAIRYGQLSKESADEWCVKATELIRERDEALEELRKVGEYLKIAHECFAWIKKCTSKLKLTCGACVHQNEKGFNYSREALSSDFMKKVLSEEKIISYCKEPDCKGDH